MYSANQVTEQKEKLDGIIKSMDVKVHCTCCKQIVVVGKPLCGVRMDFFKTVYCFGLQVLKSMKNQEAQTLDLSTGTNPAIAVGTK